MKISRSTAAAVTIVSGLVVYIVGFPKFVDYLDGLNYSPAEIAVLTQAATGFCLLGMMTFLFEVMHIDALHGSDGVADEFDDE